MVLNIQHFIFSFTFSLLSDGNAANITRKWWSFQSTQVRPFSVFCYPVKNENLSILSNIFPRSEHSSITHHLPQ